MPSTYAFAILQSLPMSKYNQGRVYPYTRAMQPGKLHSCLSARTATREELPGHLQHAASQERPDGGPASAPSGPCLFRWRPPPRV